MSKYFHSNEWDDVVSIERVRREYDAFQLDGYYLDEPFEYYLENCMSWNNGDLTPLRDYIESLTRRLQVVIRYYMEDIGDRELYEEQINELTLQIEQLKQYKEE